MHQQQTSFDIVSFSAGEHWLGTQAKEKVIINAIGTSDDLLIAEIDSYKVISVRYTRRKLLVDRFTASVA